MNIAQEAYYKKLLFILLGIFLLLVIGFSLYNSESLTDVMMVVFMIFWMLVTYSKIWQYIKNDFFNDIKSFNISRPYRDLTKSEHEELEKFVTKEERTLRPLTVPVPPSVLYSFFFLGIVIYGLISLLIDYETNVLFWILAICILVAMVYLILVILFDRIKAGERDLSSPVHLVQGKCVLAYEDKEVASLFDFRVDSYEFVRDKTTKKYQEIVDGLKNGDDVTVEFSPRTRYVWKVERV